MDGQALGSARQLSARCVEMYASESKRDLVITNIQSEQVNGTSRVSADVDGSQIWFESPDIQLQSAPEAFASAMVLPAAAIGRPLIVHDPVDEYWSQQVPRLLELANRWWGFESIPPRLTPNLAPETNSVGRTGLFFSAGVDSFHSLIHPPQPLDDLVYIEGFDVMLDQCEVLRGARECVRHVAEKLNIRPIIVRTNVRQHPTYRMIAWEYSHGGVLAAVGHLLTGHLDTLMISASYPRTWKDARWGTHWEMDPLWSSSRMEFKHVGADLIREDKLRHIADNSLVRQHLRVCWEKPTMTGNCGQCEKCVRTRLILLKHHPAMAFPALPSHETLAMDIDKLATVNADLCEIYRRLADGSIPDDVSHAIDRLVARSKAVDLHNLSLLSRIGSRIKRYARRMGF